jgi:hypothetical protein
MVAMINVDDDRTRASILLVALENAVTVLEADDALLSLFDPKYSGTPECIAEWRALVESMRS